MYTNTENQKSENAFLSLEFERSQTWVDICLILANQDLRQVNSITFSSYLLNACNYTWEDKFGRKKAPKKLELIAGIPALLAAFSQMTALKQVKFLDCHLMGSALAAKLLQAIPAGLESVSFYKCWLSDKSVDSFVTALSKHKDSITKLNLGGNNQLPRESIAQVLQVCNKVIKLDVSNMDWNGNQLQLLNDVAARLTKLNLCDVETLNHDDLRSFLKHCSSNLAVLYTWGACEGSNPQNPEITKEDIAHLTGLKKLLTLGDVESSLFAKT